MPYKSEFISQIADAYRHLYDLAYLRTHPLVDVLTPSSLPAKKKARRLHQLLLDVIGELDPGPQAPTFSHGWQRHRLLMLRYVKGLSTQGVADQLAISQRHYYRVHNTAIEEVGDLLWDRYQARQSSDQPVEEETPGETPIGHLELLRLEAARIAQADRYTHVGDVIENAIPILREMMHSRQLDVHLTLPRPLPGVSVDQNLMRQMVLGMLGYLVERAEEAEIQITVQLEGAVAHLTLAVQPPHAIELTAGAEDQLAAFEEMATLSGTHILPMRVGKTIVGFEVHVPTAERAVLIVDDNEDVLELIRSYLSPHLYRAVTVQTASEALEEARRLQPYAITLDLMMPGQDGWSLLQVLLNQPETRHIPIIVCSVLKQKELALSLGAAAFLEKPITQQSLLSTLEALTET
jgi:CheY-like chemotaxis protein